MSQSTCLIFVVSFCTGSILFNQSVGGRPVYITSASPDQHLIYDDDDDERSVTTPEEEEQVEALSDGLFTLPFVRRRRRSSRFVVDGHGSNNDEYSLITNTAYSPGSIFPLFAFGSGERGMEDEVDPEGEKSILIGRLIYSPSTSPFGGRGHSPSIRRHLGTFEGFRRPTKTVVRQWRRVSENNNKGPILLSYQNFLQNWLKRRYDNADSSSNGSNDNEMDLSRRKFHHNGRLFGGGFGEDGGQSTRRRRRRRRKRVSLGRRNGAEFPMAGHYLDAAAAARYTATPIGLSGYAGDWMIDEPLQRISKRSASESDIDGAAEEGGGRNELDFNKHISSHRYHTPFHFSMSLFALPSSSSSENIPIPIDSNPKSRQIYFIEEMED